MPYFLEHIAVPPIDVAELNENTDCSLLSQFKALAKYLCHSSISLCSSVPTRSLEQKSSVESSALRYGLSRKDAICQAFLLWLICSIFYAFARAIIRSLPHRGPWLHPQVQY